MTGIRLHTCWSSLRNYVLEAIQTRTVSNFGAFYYMFIVNVGLCNESEFARTKIHQKLKQKHALYLENTKIVQSVCTEVLVVLDSKKTQVENAFLSEISVFSAAAIIGYRKAHETNCWLCVTLFITVTESALKYWMVENVHIRDFSSLAFYTTPAPPQKVTGNTESLHVAQ